MQATLAESDLASPCASLLVILMKMYRFLLVENGPVSMDDLGGLLRLEFDLRSEHKSPTYIHSVVDILVESVCAGVFVDTDSGPTLGFRLKDTSMRCDVFIYSIKEYASKRLALSQNYQKQPTPSSFSITADIVGEQMKQIEPPSSFGNAWTGVSATTTPPGLGNPLISVSPSEGSNRLYAQQLQQQQNQQDSGFLSSLSMSTLSPSEGSALGSPMSAHTKIQTPPSNIVKSYRDSVLRSSVKKDSESSRYADALKSVRTDKESMTTNESGWGQKSSGNNNRVTSSHSVSSVASKVVKQSHGMSSFLAQLRKQPSCMDIIFPKQLHDLVLVCFMVIGKEFEFFAHREAIEFAHLVSTLKLVPEFVEASKTKIRGVLAVMKNSMCLTTGYRDDGGVVHPAAYQNKKNAGLDENNFPGLQHVGEDVRWVDTAATTTSSVPGMSSVTFIKVGSGNAPPPLQQSQISSPAILSLAKDVNSFQDIRLKHDAFLKEFASGRWELPVPLHSNVAPASTTSGSRYQPCECHLSSEDWKTMLWNKQSGEYASWLQKCNRVEELATAYIRSKDYKKFAMKQDEVAEKAKESQITTDEKAKGQKKSLEKAKEFLANRDLVDKEKAKREAGHPRIVPSLADSSSNWRSGRSEQGAQVQLTTPLNLNLHTLTRPRMEGSEDSICDSLATPYSMDNSDPGTIWGLGGRGAGMPLMSSSVSTVPSVITTDTYDQREAQYQQQNSLYSPGPEIFAAFRPTGGGLMPSSNRYSTMGSGYDSGNSGASSLQSTSRPRTTQSQVPTVSHLAPPFYPGRSDVGNAYQVQQHQLQQQQQQQYQQEQRAFANMRQQSQSVKTQMMNQQQMPGPYPLSQMHPMPPIADSRQVEQSLDSGGRSDLLWDWNVKNGTPFSGGFDDSTMRPPYRSSAVQESQGHSQGHGQGHGKSLDDIASDLHSYAPTSSHTTHSNSTVTATSPSSNSSSFNLSSFNSFKESTGNEYPVSLTNLTAPRLRAPPPPYPPPARYGEMSDYIKSLPRPIGTNAAAATAAAASTSISIDDAKDHSKFSVSDLAPSPPQERRGPPPEVEQNKTVARIDHRDYDPPNDQPFALDMNDLNGLAYDGKHTEDRPIWMRDREGPESKLHSHGDQDDEIMSFYIGDPGGSTPIQSPDRDKYISRPTPSRPVILPRPATPTPLSLPNLSPIISSASTSTSNSTVDVRNSVDSIGSGDWEDDDTSLAPGQYGIKVTTTQMKEGLDTPSPPPPHSPAHTAHTVDTTCSTVKAAHGQSE